MKIDNEWMQKHLVSGQEYMGRYRAPSPRIVCIDATTVSVQAGTSLYSSPRWFDGPYSQVEVGFPSVKPDWWDSEDDVMGYVDIDQVIDWINSHGGVDEPMMILIHKD